jgi:hypothetical protein
MPGELRLKLSTVEHVDAYTYTPTHVVFSVHTVTGKVHTVTWSLRMLD